MESVPNVTNSQRVNTLADIPDFATGLPYHRRQHGFPE
jgi:hypothetical protein